MTTIDLSDDQIGSFCLLCDTTGPARLAALLDRDLGPLCHECFTHALRASVELRWAAALHASQPSHNATSYE